MAEVKRYMIRCDQDTCDLLAKRIVEGGQTEPRVSEVKGFGGEIVDYLIVGTVSIKAVTSLLNMVISAIKLKREIKALRLEDKELNKPTETEIKKLMQEFDPK